MTTLLRPEVRAVQSLRGRRGLGSVEIVGCYLILLAAIPGTLVFAPLGAVGTPATIVACGAFVVWAVAALTSPSLLVRSVTPLRVLLGCLWVVVLASFAVMHLHQVPAVEVRSADRYLISLLGWTGIALLTAEGIASKVEMYRLVRLLVWSTAVVAVVALVQFYLGADPTALIRSFGFLTANSEAPAIGARSGFRRPAGTATHPIELSFVLAMVMPVAIHLAVHDRHRPRWQRWLPVVVFGLALPISVSRSAILGAVTAFTVVFVGWSTSMKLRALAAAPLVLVVTFMTAPGLLGTLRNLILRASQDDSISGRTDDYRVVARLVGQSPLIGRGPGTFLGEYRILDNQYLLSAIEIGIIGLLVMTAYFAASILFGRGARHRSSDDVERDLGQALAAGGAVAVVSGLAFDALSFEMFAGLIPLVLGLSALCWSIVAEREDPIVRGPNHELVIHLARRRPTR